MFPKDAIHNTCDINGLRTHYIEAGSGEPLVLLHGFPETSYAWRKVIPRLSTHFRVIAPDMRGCGDSDRTHRRVRQAKRRGRRARFGTAPWPLFHSAGRP